MLRRNLIANYIGQSWRALMGLAFIPLYIHYLGMEAYGLIGTYAVLQTALGLLENGLNPALAREMARFLGGGHGTQSIRDLLRSVEIIIATLAALVSLGVWASSSWLASNWLNPASLRVDVVAQALTLMGAVISLRFIENIYSSSILGLQQQIIQNVVTSITATLRGLGAVAILAWVSPTIEAFFIWQAAVSLVTSVWFASIVYRTLPSTAQRARFSSSELAGIWRFATGMIGLTILSVFLTQVDKVLLSKTLLLDAFGYYTLATVIAASLFMTTGPISNAFYPRLTQLLTSSDSKSLHRIYHQGSQLITVLMGTGATLLVFFGERIVFVWTGNAHLAGEVAPVLAVLAASTLLSGLNLMPYHLQLASGWTSLRLWIDSLASLVVLPVLFLLVPHYGALGAAWTLLAVNALRILANVPLMHRRLLRTEQSAWWVKDIAIPLAGALLGALVLRWIMPVNPGRMGQAGILILTGLAVLIISSMSSALVREHINTRFFGKVPPCQSRACMSASESIRFALFRIAQDRPRKE